MKKDSINENFLDGRNPEDKGDMARHGLKGKTIAQLKAIRSSKKASPRKKQLAHWYINMHKEEHTIDEDLRKWFREKWVRMDTKGNIKGDCAREPGEGKPKCLPLAKARAMDKKDRATATKRKRREDPVADRPGKGGAPVNVRTEQIEYIEEKNTPTNPELWSRAKALARSKFDVYPSAYANGWAAKWYKSKGGSWKAVGEEMTNPYTDVLQQLEEAKATYCGRCGTKHVHPSQGGKCPAVKEEVVIDEARIETDSGTANVTDTHINFNNSGFRRKFTHQEIHKMDKGETVRGFKNEKDHPYADKHTSVYSDGDEEHHLPNHAKKSVSEERIVEVKTSTLQSYLQKRSAGRIKSAAATIFKGKDSPEVKSHEKREAGMERARKKLAPHYAAQAAERAKKQREELKKNNPPHEVKKRLDAAKAEYERSYGPVEKAGHQYAEGNGYYRGKELHSKYHALKQLHKEVSEETINELVPAVLAALGRGAGVASRVLGPLASSAASGALSAAGNAVSGIAQGVGTAVSGVAQGVGNAVSGIAQGVGNAVSGNGEEKKKKTTVSNTDYVKEAMSASHRFALALQRERERRELKDQARAAREAAGKTVSFTNYLKPKGPKDEKTN